MIIEPANKIFLYHYDDKKEIDKMMKSGKIISASYLENTGTYDDRVKKKKMKNQKELFEERYNKLYKDVLGTPYNGDWGVYFTPIDDYTILETDYRLTLNFNEIKKNGNKILWSNRTPKREAVLIETESQLLFYYNKYLRAIKNDVKGQVAKAKKETLKFRHIPQIIVYAGEKGIPIYPRHLEKRKK